MKSALQDAPSFDALVLDGKPNASEQTLDIAKAADLVVIPTEQTIDDLHPGVTLAHSLIRRGIPTNRVVFALCKTTGSARENDAARQYLQDAGYQVLRGEIPVSTTYGSASDLGKAITETSYLSLNQKASKLAQSIVDGLSEQENWRAA